MSMKNVAFQIVLPEFFVLADETVNIIVVSGSSLFFVMDTYPARF